jgi:putative colanic acid biosynthesis acetyltransferase WcaF
MTKTNLSKFNNSWYNPGANALKRLFWYFTNAVWINSAFPINGIKLFLLRLYGAKIGSRVVIKPHVNIKYPWLLEVGNNVWIGEYVWIDNLAKVSIADDVCISQGALLLCGNHNYKKEAFDLIVAEIKLEQGVWIGAKSTVCPGVTCHSHAVLAVGSVATSNLEPYSIYQGNPAKKIRERKIDA